MRSSESEMASSTQSTWFRTSIKIGILSWKYQHGVCQMGRQKYVVQLTDDEREHLRKMARGGLISARGAARARILLKADAGWPVVRIADALDVAQSTVCRIKKRYLQEGLTAAIEERQRPGASPKLDEKGEAYLIALACSPAPDGHARWTLRLLADKAVELGMVDTISHEGIRKRLKKTDSSRGRTRSGAFLR